MAIPFHQLAAQNPGGNTPLEFQHRERIVFLGNSLFENELTNGYLEFALTSRWPDRELSFRNLGWTGDNVFAEARTTFSTPPTAYQQLFQQIRAARPNHVLIAYGGVESQEGEPGLAKFVDGLSKIIDSLDAIGANTVLLSTVPVKFAGSDGNTTLQNQNLERYADAISKLATERKKRFVDLYGPMSTGTEGLYLDNGIHLNENGYYTLAGILETGLGWPARGEKVTINAGKLPVVSEGSAHTVSGTETTIRFLYQEKLLPLPTPADGKASPSQSVTIQINGLKKGFYVLTENGRQLVMASAQDWAKGMPLDHGVSQVQSERICEYIVKKNDLFFQQYRPLNRTYILGFRAYEQGRHKQGLQDLNFIITWLEGQVNLTRQPTTKTYEISLVK